MNIEKGGGGGFRIMAIEREAMIIGDLPPQGFAGRELGLLGHTA